MTKAKQPENRPPKGLSARAAEFWRAANDKYMLEAHDLARLHVACRAITDSDAADDAIAKDGRFVPDRYGAMKVHPAVAVARDARALLLRAIREMAIDVDLPSEARIPRQDRRYR